MQLKDTQLFRQQAYIDGVWLDADSGQTINVNNPATGEILGTVPKMGAAETRRAIEAAEKALPAWRALTAKDRANKLRRWFELIIENQDDLARLMTLEQGKPLAEAKGEIVYAASFIEWFAEEAKRVYGDVIPGHQPDKRLIVIKQPIGVTAAITPWNFPAATVNQGQHCAAHAQQPHRQQGKADSRRQQQQIESGVHQLKEHRSAGDQQQTAANALHPVLDKLIFQRPAKPQPTVTPTLLRQQQGFLSREDHGL